MDFSSLYWYRNGEHLPHGMTCLMKNQNERGAPFYRITEMVSKATVGDGEKHAKIRDEDNREMRIYTMLIDWLNYKKTQSTISGNLRA